MAQYYDHKTSSEVEARAKLLRLKAWESPSLLKNKFYVMQLDFSGLLSYPYTLENFTSNFNFKLHRQVDAFVKKYGLESEVPDIGANAVDYFVRVITAVNDKNPNNEDKKEKKAPLIIIDEYDTSTNLLLLKHGENLPKDVGTVPLIHFFSELKALCSDRRAHTYVTGISPLTLSEFGGGFNIACRPQDDAYFADMFGFTKAEMQYGIKSAGVTDDFKSLSDGTKLADQLLQWYTEQYHGYRFHKDAPTEGVINPNQAIYEFKKLQQYIKRHGGGDPDAILRFVKDPAAAKDANSMPAEHVLEMVETIPAVGDLLPLIAPVGGVVCIPKLDPFVEAQDLLQSSDISSPLCTFLYHHGVLTHAKRDHTDCEEDDSPSTEDIQLAAPNRVARMEILEEILKRYQISKSDAKRLKSSLGNPSEFLTTLSQIQKEKKTHLEHEEMGSL